MLEDETQDLYDFMQQCIDEMAAEYDDAQEREAEDPTNTRSRAAESWAKLLRGWLPSTYEVVTNGRIISRDGRISRWVDVLVLKSAYPEKLVNKDVYLAASVAAAFECETTLAAAHIARAVRTCTEIKRLYSTRIGTPYRELHAPVIYGLLARSYSWKGEDTVPASHIEQKFLEADGLYVVHPRECLDLLCVANLGTWRAVKVLAPLLLASHCGIPISSVLETGFTLQTAYMMAESEHENQGEPLTPIGSFIFDLSRKLAWEDVNLRELSQYYQGMRIDNLGSGKPRSWDFSFSESVTRQLLDHRFNLDDWSEWSVISGF